MKMPLTKLPLAKLRALQEESNQPSHSEPAAELPHTPRDSTKLIFPMGLHTPRLAWLNKASKKACWFGVSLDEQSCELDQGKRVPKLALTLRRKLEAEAALDHEGLFRESANATMLSVCKERLANGEDPEEVCCGCSVALLSCLFKEWLRCLPGGLWGSSAPHAYAELERAVLAQGGPATRPTMSRAAPSATPRPLHVAMLLKQGMPPQQRELLLWVLDFLAECAAHEAASRMGVEQLAICFAPVLMPANEKTKLPASQQMADAMRAIEVTRRLIEGHAAAKKPASTSATSTSNVASACTSEPSEPPRVAKRGSEDMMSLQAPPPSKQRSVGSEGFAQLRLFELIEC